MHSLKFFTVLLLALAGVFIVDQNIKQIFLDGYRFYSDCIDLTLVFNKGVAFSMFAFLGAKLKFIQIFFILGVLAYIAYLRKQCYAFPGGILLGAALSNVYDRFIHGGVVDMVHWHCWFDFAIFNFADVMIDFAVGWLLLLNLIPNLCKR